jgi:hypothetical protein
MSDLQDLIERVEKALRPFATRVPLRPLAAFPDTHIVARAGIEIGYFREVARVYALLTALSNQSDSEGV